MTRLADLMALQDLDLTLERRRQALADVRHRMADESALAAAREEAAAQQSAVERLERRQRDLETQVEDLRAHLTPLETRLYDGSVRNPKELQGLQQDVESLRRRQRSLEDQALAAMAEAEDAAAVLAERRREVERAEQERARALAALRAEEAALEEEIGGLEAQRAGLAGRVDPADLRLYERLRSAKGGRAVVRLERGVCQGCRLTVPSTVATRARSGLQVVQCPSCERILYLG
ncbi:MAG TPA: C4-type zinc ribbon domain-containing protein [Dehalococcoidia bacterium]